MPAPDYNVELDLGEPPPELQEYARLQCGEDPNTKLQAIYELKEMIYERGECNPHRMDDEFLLRFLRARNFIPQRAHRLMVNYYQFKEENQDLFENVYPLDLRRIGDANVLAVPPYRDQNGRRLLIYRIVFIMADSKEDRKVKKRLAERRRKARIKSDPELYAVHKEKDRQRYYKKRNEGKVKSVSKLDPRQQRIVREKSRISSNKYNLKKRREKLRCLEEDLIIPEAPDDTDDPLVSSNSNILKSITPGYQPPGEPISLPSTSSFGALAPLSQRIKGYRDSSVPLSPSSDISVVSRPCTRSFVRVIERDFPETPQAMKRNLNTKVVVRRLKYRMNKMLQLQKEKYDKLKTVNERYRKQIYRLKSQVAELRKYLPSRITKTSSTKPQRSEDVRAEIKNNVEEDIKTFLEEDENSRMCAGKKEFITRKKDKKQKRYLNNSLKDLHIKFNQENSKNKMSYSSFCKKRPFWILKPDVNKRETCLCVEHENMELMVMALKKANIINEKFPKEILSSLCCDSSNMTCLTRKCDNCKYKTLISNEFDNNEELFYWHWQKSKKTYSKNGETRTTVHTAKDKVATFPRDAILKFEKMIIPYMTHCAIMLAQTTFIKKLKSDLTHEECIIHCDFSENYCTKYANEIQAVHFGGNRQQITLHTVVVYYRKNGNFNVQSICTLSESLRHDAPAIWEHLIPIFKFLEDENIKINKLHFISDSPSGQYRNRKLFYIISKLHWYIPSLTSITWNYTESGHGKGAPDGVGATIKRTADQLVAQGNDITSLNSLLTHLKSVKGIITEAINDSGIYEKELLIPTDLKQFAGTMKVHQVVWHKSRPNQLSMRKISCAEGECKTKSVPCEHGCHIGLFIIGENFNDTTNKNIGNTNIDKPKILSNILIKTQNHFHEAEPLSPNKSDIVLRESDSFWTQVSTDCENIAPTLMNDVLANIVRDDQSSDDDLEIFPVKFPRR